MTTLPPPFDFGTPKSIPLMSIENSRLFETFFCHAFFFIVEMFTNPFDAGKGDPMTSFMDR